MKLNQPPKKKELSKLQQQLFANNPIQVNKPNNKPPKIFIATPMFGGSANYMYMISLINLLTKLGQNGIHSMFEIAANESLITKARNILVEGFLRSDATHMLFLDADLGFDPDDVLKMIQANKDLIGGQYAKKKINWDVVKRVVAGVPDIPPHAINAVIAESTFRPIGDQISFRLDEPVEVESIATGMMLIRREVFEKMAKELPEIEIISGGSETMDPKTMTRITDPHRKAHAYFDVSIDPVTKAYTSEDFTFCKRWRKIGGQVFLAPWTRTVHVGTYEYVCDLASIATYTQQMADHAPANPADTSINPVQVG
jgi:coenzyme F420-reducing hydrogenase alpha subunit